MDRLLFNIVIPVAILTWFSDHDRLGPMGAFLLALAFPLAHGLSRLARRRDIGLASALGVLSVLMTGGIGILRLGPEWLAVKEAAVPLGFGLVVLASARTRRPLAKLILDKALDLPRVHQALAARGTTAAFHRHAVRATYLWAGVLFVAAALNFGLAKLVVRSDPGTAAFNHELARMTALNLPVVTLPMMLMMSLTVAYIVHGATRLTGLDRRQIFRGLPTRPHLPARLLHALHLRR